MAVTQVPNRWLDPGEEASAARYTGIAASLTGRPSWMPVVDPWESIIAQNRAREAEAIRLANAAAAQRTSAPVLPPLPGLGGGPLPLGASGSATARTQPFEVFGEPLDGPFGGALGGALSGLSSAGQAVAGWLTSEAPNPVSPGLDPSGKPLPAGGLPPPKPGDNLPPMSYRVDSMGEQGPDRPGYKQVPVLQGGEVIGYRYVSDGSMGPDELAAQETTDAVTDPTGGMDIADRPQNYPITMSPGEQVDQWFDTQWQQVRNVQEQVWGVPREVDGELIYNYDKQKYLGIPLEMQAQGLLPAPNLPNAPGKDATQQDMNAYYKKLKDSFRVPQYEVGEEWRYWFTQDKAQRIAFQKIARQAGAYEDNEAVSRGDIGESEIRIMTDWMSRANRMGVGWEDIAEMDVVARKKVLADARAAGGGGGGGGGMDRTVNIQYTQTSVAAARTLMESVLAQAIGRPPTRTELQGFLAMLNNAENKSPTRTVTNYVRGGNSTTATSRTTPSDVDPEAMAREYAQGINGGAEFGEFQNNKYLTALVDMLRGAQNV